MKRLHNRDADIGGFTYREIRRIARMLRTNVASVRKWVRIFRLEGTTPTYAVHAIRKSRAHTSF